MSGVSGVRVFTSGVARRGAVLAPVLASVLAPVLAAACLRAAGAQQTQPVPPPVTPRPFAPERPASAPAPEVELLAPGRMSPEARQLAAEEHAAIAARAALEGFDLERGRWSLEQIACPAFPGHLLLLFTGSRDGRGAWVFSASIPRRGGGRLRILPIQRGGLSLYPAAGANQRSISVFNHMREEEGAERSPDWLGSALCYAALAGARPRVAAEPEPGDGRRVPALTAVLENGLDGRQSIRLVDAAPARPVEWRMIFGPDGRLERASRLPAQEIATRPVPAGPAASPERPVPE